MSTTGISLRPARGEDAAQIEALQQASLRGLGARFYPPEAIESAIAQGMVDEALLESGYLYLAETDSRLVGCGGWHPTAIAPISLESLYSDCGLAPPREQLSAKIRSVFVHPEWAGRGIGRRLMRHVEAEAVEAGYRHFEMLSSLPGAVLYQRLGYRARAMLTMPVGDDAALAMIHMEKVAAGDDPLGAERARAA